MNFSITEIVKSLQNFWKKLTRPQRVLLVVIPVIVAVALSLFIFWASRPQYVVLFSELETTEAGQITEELKNLKVDYQLAEGGTTIEVPQKDVAEIRLELANAGLPSKSTFSFDYLNEMRLGETEQDSRLRYVLGLQTEIETTIETMDGIDYARVHIVLPEESLFDENKEQTTAAVTIKRKTGAEISEDQVRSIANLLAYSVEGLTTEYITINDTNGNVLSDVLGNSNSPQTLTANQLQVQQSVENKMQQSVQSMLDKVLGTGTTIVRVNAAIDFDQKKITSQKTEEGTVTSREQITEKSSSTSSQGGVPGTESNIPDYLVSGNDTNSSSEKSSLTENFQPSVTQEETVVSPGQIKRLTVSVLADSDGVTDDQLSEIKTIVSSAVGIDQTRGDVIEAARIPFNKTGLLEEQAAMAAEARKAQIMMYAQIGGGVLLAVLILLFFLRSRAKKKSGANAMDLADGQKLVTLQEAEQILAAQLEAEREADLKLARKKVKSSEDIEKEKIRHEVEKFSKDNPDDVARLVKTWLTEEQ
ncbi:flagellar M-ring protein FliF [Dehalobacter sp. DCM]|uniref:flagellar basal-body MS-ring/collar protein FliF n=1 Tax=Dehalobacter sp. DCM TaxID=2907827 RepID=UPI0030817E75|nr:flagellar M-ring protein FliF [Dehalobacter sp. DCM]